MADAGDGADKSTPHDDTPSAGSAFIRSASPERSAPAKSKAPHPAGLCSRFDLLLDLVLEVTDQIAHGGDAGDILLRHLLHAELLFQGH